MLGQRILVTGGAGYIGSVLVPALLDEGHQVTVLDSFQYNDLSLATVCHRPNLKIIKGDVRDTVLLKELVQKIDYVIPLAALVGAPLCKMDPVGARTINTEAVVNLLELINSRVRVIMPTTNSAYGSNTDGECTEITPLKPMSIYAKEKVELESTLMQRVNSTSLRLATVFGFSPRMRMDLLVNDLVYRAVKDKAIVLFEADFRRNYIHVRDVANAILHFIKHEELQGQIYNVGLSSANLTKRQLCEVIKKFVPDMVVMDAPIGKDPDQRDYVVSNAKIESTGWVPRHNLGSGIEELIKGFEMMKNKIHSNY